MNTQILRDAPLAVSGESYGATTAGGTPILGADLASFTFVGASTVTNVSTCTITGNVGVRLNGANAIMGFNSSSDVVVSDPQVTGGNVHAGTALAQSAQGELTTAIVNLGSPRQVHH